MKILIQSLFIILVLYINVSLANQDKEYQYLSPKPNAKNISSQSAIIVRFNHFLATDIDNPLTCINLTDENNHNIAGHSTIASDNRTIIFKPKAALVSGSVVTVNITPNLKNAAKNIEPLKYNFTVCKSESKIINEMKNQPYLKETGLTYSNGNGPVITGTGVSVPSDFPYIDISINDNPDSGYIFLNNWGDIPYNVIFDNSGAPIWYRRTPDRRRDFKVQQNGNLTMLVREGYPFGQGFIELNQNYEEVNSYDAVNGYSTDEHELQVLEDGTYLLLGIRTVTVDMSGIVPGGKTNAQVSESALQMFTPEGDLILQFAALEKFNPADMIGYSPDDQPTDQFFRFPHMNSISIDDDDNIILSSKRISEVTKIDRNTGEIIWRLGGANNQFEFINDPLDGFFNQHSVRALSNGHYTIFDNGCLHNPQVSRALEYELDTENMTATLVWSFIEEPPTYAFHMGNVQRLPNGNTLINWAVEDLPKLTEVRPDGSKAFEMNFVDRYKSYRVFRFPWNGIARKPYLLIEPQLDNITLLINQFGDPDVDHYRIYGGTHHNSSTLIDTSHTTLKPIFDLENGRTYYFRATSVDRFGYESDYSNEESIVVNMIVPGQNMVLNGDFSSGEEHWILDVNNDNDASANSDTDNNLFQFLIENGGNNLDDIRLIQNGFLITHGRDYLIEFDAWADNPRIIELEVGLNNEPYTDYCRIGFTYITPVQTHYSYKFKMNDLTDGDTRLVINAGGSNIDVYVDNISLEIDENPDNMDERKPLLSENFELKQNYPNPFNPSTNIEFRLAKLSDVTISIYNLLGQKIRTLLNCKLKSGNHSVQWDGKDDSGLLVASGIYFYRLHAGNFIRTKKLIFEK